MKRVVAMFALVVFASTSWAQQADEALARRLDAVTKVVAPGARLVPMPVNPRPGRQVRRWALSGSTRLTVEIRTHASSDDAERLMDRRRRVISVPTTTIEGIGDDAFIVAAAPDGERTVVFRRGVVVIEVVALGEDATIRFARLFVTEIDRSEAAGELGGGR